VKAEAIRELDADALKAREKELQEQLFRLRLQTAVGQGENPLKLRETRRDIARVKTILREKRTK
jgi:large subunit ribosomal protein L29